MKQLPWIIGHRTGAIVECTATGKTAVSGDQVQMGLRRNDASCFRLKGNPTYRDGWLRDEDGVGPTINQVISADRHVPFLYSSFEWHHLSFSSRVGTSVELKYIHWYTKFYILRQDQAINRVVHCKVCMAAVCPLFFLQKSTGRNRIIVTQYTCRINCCKSFPGSYAQIV